MSTKKKIGRIPISKGKYVAGQTYNRLSQVTLYGSTYQSMVDGNTSAPAILDENGNVQHTNTDQWLVIADGREAYNAGERTSCFSMEENPEFMVVETDAEGRILASTNADGSHYIHNVHSETIPEEISSIEDIEGRLEMTRDAEGKIISFRDKDGILHEERIAANHVSLSDDAAKEVNEAFKSAGINIENHSDFSNDSYIELPIPRVAALLRLYANRLPITKNANIDAKIEYIDKDGNFFRKDVVLNAQGSSSMYYFVKNLSIDFKDGVKLKFGDFPAQDGFHLKKYYIDIFRGQCIVGYWLMEQIYKSRPIGEQYPYEYLNKNASITDSFGKCDRDFFTGAKCHPDGFPITIEFYNLETGKVVDMGVYAFNLKKHRDIYYCDKKNAKNIILDGVIGDSSLFNGSIWWSGFEIRNPKSLKDIEENDYNGDSPKELSNNDVLSKEVKNYITRFAGVNEALNTSNTKETFEEYFLVNPFIDYYLLSQILYNFDGFNKNWIWCTWDGTHWAPTAYDLDSIFGAFYDGTFVYPETDIAKLAEEYSNNPNIVEKLKELYNNDINQRYKELRDEGVFTVENIIGLLQKWVTLVGYENYKKEIQLYPETPSYRNPNLSDKWTFVGCGKPSAGLYDESKQYKKGDFCSLNGYVFKAVEDVCNVSPILATYKEKPREMGFFNSVFRVQNWLTKRINALDKVYNYNV